MLTRRLNKNLLVFLLSLPLALLGFILLKKVIFQERESAPLVLSTPPASEKVCTAYSELRNVNFLDKDVRDNICEDVAAYTIVDSAFPLCRLKKQLPQLLTDAVRAGSLRTTLTSPVSKRSVPCFVYSSPDLISKEIRETHIFEETSVKTVQKLIQKFGAKSPVTFVDIGANIGVFTLAALDLGVPVVALDANIRNLMRIKLSSEAAQLPHQLHLLWNFISRRVSLMYLNFPEDCNIGGATKFGRAVADTIPVMSATADAVAELIGTKVVILKVDIEGGEGEFFKSAPTLFDRFTIPVVQMEWLDRHMSEEERRFMISFFQDRNYGVKDLTRLNAAVNISSKAFESGQIIWIRSDYYKTVFEVIQQEVS